MMAQPSLMMATRPPLTKGRMVSFVTLWVLVTCKHSIQHELLPAAPKEGHSHAKSSAYVRGL